MYASEKEPLTRNSVDIVRIHYFMGLVSVALCDLTIYLSIWNSLTRGCRIAFCEYGVLFDTTSRLLHKQNIRKIDDELFIRGRVSI